MVLDMDVMKPSPQERYAGIPTMFKWVYLPKAKPEFCWIVEDTSHKYKNAYCLWGHILEEHPLGGFDNDRFEDERVK
jgi:hypothetical protein